MPRKAQQKGTPGVGYSNRTDLAQNRSSGSAAVGSGQNLPTSVPSSPAAQEPAPKAPLMRYPTESPMLSDETYRKDEPITAGLSTGPGPGREVLSLGGRPVRPTLTQTLQKLQQFSDDPQIAAILNVAGPRGW